MDFVTAVKTCLTQKYADFNGRATRPEFWWFVLFCFLVNVASQVILGRLAGIVMLALFVPSIAVGARRLHDIGKSGWLQLIGIIPLIGWAIVIYWGVQPGDPAANKYGEAPASTPPAAPEVAPGQQ